MYGLTSAEAQKKLAENGTNTLAQERKSRPLKIFIGQFRDMMVIILLGAAAVSFLLGELYDSVTIILIVLMNAILGFIQEYRTEKTLEALSKMTSPTARAYRDGALVTLPAEEIVVGDVIELEAGDRVPADCLLINARGVFADEAILTGEAVAVCKQSGGKSDGTLNQPNMVYAGTIITKGHAVGRVTATGKQTQMGRISGMLSEIEPTQTPLQKRLGELGRVLALICLAVCVIVFGAGTLRGEPVFDMLLTGITIAIAAIPEGLPATVTIALALAVSRMLKQKALVNRLHSVETLGCASVICSDKTGTITENKMTVTAIFSGMDNYEVSGNGCRISGEITYNGANASPMHLPHLKKTLVCAVMCNNAKITTDENIESRSRSRLTAPGQWQAVGDPTETALLIAAAKGGVTAENTGFELKRVDEIPFDSENRCMTVIASLRTGEKTAFTKGAADVILSRCGYIMTGSEILPMTITIKRSIEQKAAELSSNALRVLAFAEKTLADGSDIESGMVFLGLTGMLDPPREEARKAIKTCARAHIKTVMITGDHKNTALAIAKQAGLLRGKAALTGEELDRMSDAELSDKINDYTVFARVNPSHKLRLVRAYKAKGHIVTMTGDGVNDAPAIKEADVGVAMGITGTDVTKQAADVILLDDNFATLVKAVEQGRSIYANIRKFVRYLLSCNIGEVITMFVGILMGFPIVLLPTQILLVNLVTDGLPAIALSMEPLDKGVMNRPPRRSDESFFSDGLMGKIIFRGILIGLCTLACFSTILRMDGTLTAARTGALLTLVLSQLIHVFECKSETGSIFSVKYLSNMRLVGAVLISLVIIAAAVYSPALQLIFTTVALGKYELLAALGFSVAVPVLAGLIRR